MDRVLERPADPFAVIRVDRPDGSILLENANPLPPYAGTIFGRLTHWAEATPEAVWLSDGDRQLDYQGAEAQRRDLSARLLSAGLDKTRPLMILADNGIDHALFMLAATAIGMPVAIVSPAYAAANAAPWSKLDRVLVQIEPELILADDPAAVGRALAALGRECRVEALGDHGWINDFQPTSAEALARAEQSAGPDTVAKLLFTSGSTGTPKAVMNTQRMMVSNMVALSVVWPFLSERPPVMVDWLPWNHTFGGNCCFNMALWFGAHMHIDRGRPAPGLIDRTAAAIRALRPSIYFNVPVGYELLLPQLEQDSAFAELFFNELDFLFNAGAPMPASTRARLEKAALAVTGKPLNIVGGWGSTETAPFSTVLGFPTPHSTNLGVPIPGTTIKMAPDGDRYELRVRGPNVTPGYWNDPKTTAEAFDSEGFYRIGDAARFADPADAGKGIVFNGRVAENFKLSSGTFVNVGALRLAVISAGEKLISDAVIAGEGRNELGALIFPNENACRALLGEEACAALGGRPAASHEAVTERIGELLRVYNAGATGSSVRIARFRILCEPPSAAHDEITDKGYLNQRRILARRAAEVERMFEEAAPL